MPDNPNTPWECEGAPPKYPTHPLIENPAGTEQCIICGRPRNVTVSTKTGSPKPVIPLKPIGLTVLSLALLGGIAYGANAFFKPCPLNQEKKAFKCVPLPPPPLPPSSVVERYSSGEHRLFIGKINPDGESGIEAFKDGRYRQAIQDFERAIQGDRNSPEFQIYLNNAKARLAGSPFLIGAVVPIDSSASSAEEMLRGVADAQTRFNEAGGLDGQLVEIVIANDSNKPTLSKKVAKKLASDGNILGVIGHNSSNASQAALEEYEKAGIPMISPTSTSTNLSGDSFFRTVPSDAINGQKLAEYARNTLGIETVAIFYNPNSSYSQSLETAFAEGFEQLGGQVVETIDLSDALLNPQQAIQNIQGRADAIALFPNTQYITDAIALAVANKNQMQLLGGDALYNPNTLISGSNEIEGLVLAIPWFAEGNYSELAEKRWLGQVSWRTAMSFDATQALINALSKNASRSQVLQNLGNVSLSRTQTSGDILEFESTGERKGEPILVQAVKGSQNAPQGSQFSFQPID